MLQVEDDVAARDGLGQDRAGVGGRRARGRGPRARCAARGRAAAARRWTAAVAGSTRRRARRGTTPRRSRGGRRPRRRRRAGPRPPRRRRRRARRRPRSRVRARAGSSERTEIERRSWPATFVATCTARFVASVGERRRPAPMRRHASATARRAPRLRRRGTARARRRRSRDRGSRSTPARVPTPAQRRRCHSDGRVSVATASDLASCARYAPLVTTMAATTWPGDDLVVAPRQRRAPSRSPGRPSKVGTSIVVGGDDGHGARRPADRADGACLERHAPRAEVVRGRRGEHERRAARRRRSRRRRWRVRRSSEVLVEDDRDDLHRGAADVGVVGHDVAAAGCVGVARLDPDHAGLGRGTACTCDDLARDGERHRGHAARSGRTSGCAMSSDGEVQQVDGVGHRARVEARDVDVGRGASMPERAAPPRSCRATIASSEPATMRAEHRGEVVRRVHEHARRAAGAR